MCHTCNHFYEGGREAHRGMYQGELTRGWVEICVMSNVHITVTSFERTPYLGNVLSDYNRFDGAEFFLTLNLNLTLFFAILCTLVLRPSLSVSLWLSWCTTEAITSTRIPGKPPALPMSFWRRLKLINFSLRSFRTGLPKLKLYELIKSLLAVGTVVE